MNAGVWKRSGLKTSILEDLNKLRYMVIALTLNTEGRAKTYDVKV